MGQNQSQKNPRSSGKAESSTQPNTIDKNNKKSNMEDITDQVSQMQLSQPSSESADNATPPNPTEKNNKKSNVENFEDQISQTQLSQPSSESAENSVPPNLTEKNNEKSNVENTKDQGLRTQLSQPCLVNNLNTLLADIHKKYVALDRDEFQTYFRVFGKVIYPLHEAMKKVDPYYGRYSSRVQFAGSHYDRLRINKPDEFDVDIVIGLPVNMKVNSSRPEESDIIIQPQYPGFVQLKAGLQYKNIVFRDGADCAINVQAYKWLDKQDYILRSRFTDWFKSVVAKALNTFEKQGHYPSIVIDGTVYTIENSTSGPAFTLYIKNSAGFKLDVDLVPAIRFPEDRWPVAKSYRDIPDKKKADYWMVVPKPNKNGANSHDEDRSWRVAMHDQERKIIHGTYSLRTVNRLLKKLRDAQGMDYIASYYIKTLFLWKIIEKDSSYWQQDVASIFKEMLNDFHVALTEKKIRYFWNQNNNMIERVPEHILKGYANKLNNLISKLPNDYMLAARFLLTPDEYLQYKTSIGFSEGAVSSSQPSTGKNNKKSITEDVTDQVSRMQLSQPCSDNAKNSTQPNSTEKNNKKSITENVTNQVLRKQPSQPCVVNNLNTLLADIHKRYVALDRNEFQTYFRVFEKVIYPLHEAMKKVDSYYGRYSSRVQFAGSHYDRLRINKPDEFDVDIVIGLPVNMKVNSSRPEESDIVIQPQYPGFVQLKAGLQYKNIVFRDGADCAINVQAYKWLDKQDYILRSRFTDWFKSVVAKALNTFEKQGHYPSIVIDGTVYTIENSTSGPAFTLYIKNSAGFKLDVDLVPAIRFPEDRWPVAKSYRDIPDKKKADYWMVVPKPNKNGANSHDEDRSWRVAMHDQERKIIHGSYNMRTVNRLLKKLRDAQAMDYIASYYIKSLFLWKTDEKDSSYWQQDVASIFKEMLNDFHVALTEKKIRYFWNQNNNMIERVPEHILKGYANKLNNLISKLQNDYMLAARFLLTPDEYSQYVGLLDLSDS